MSGCMLFYESADLVFDSLCMDWQVRLVNKWIKQSKKKANYVKTEKKHIFT